MSKTRIKPTTSHLLQCSGITPLSCMQHKLKHPLAQESPGTYWGGGLKNVVCNFGAKILYTAYEHKNLLQSGTGSK